MAKAPRPNLSAYYSGVGTIMDPQFVRELADNGMDARIVYGSTGPMLQVQSHDSPVRSFRLTKAQLADLVADCSSGYGHKRAYKTFVNLVRKEFDVPVSYVNFKNVNSPVTMGNHGVKQWLPRLYPGGMDSPGLLAWAPRLASWDSMHLRYMPGRYPFQAPATVMMGARFDNSLRAGELRPGGYGFYWKGAQEQKETDPLKNALPDMSDESIFPEREKKTAIPVDFIAKKSCPNTFTADRFLEAMATHGIEIDQKNKTLKIKSGADRRNVDYDLGKEEDNRKGKELLALMTNEDLDKVPYSKRLEALNAYLERDWDKPVTMDMLTGTERISIRLKDSAVAEIHDKWQKDCVESGKLPRCYATPQEIAAADNGIDIYREGHPSVGAVINGNELFSIGEGLHWARPGDHGRQVQVGEISVAPSQPATVTDVRADKAQGADGRDAYLISAVVNGEYVTREVEEKDYKNFLAAMGKKDGEEQKGVKNLQSVMDDLEKRIKSSDSLHLGGAIDRLDNGKHGVEVFVDGSVLAVAVDEKQYAKALSLANGGTDSDKAKFAREVLKSADFQLESLNNDGTKVTARINGQLNTINSTTEEAQRISQAEMRRTEASNFAFAPVDQKKFDKVLAKVFPEGNTAYTMSAVINGEQITHEISQKDFDKFLALDDYGRMRLFSQKFPEVELKGEQGKDIMGKVFAGLAAAAVGAGLVVGIKNLIDGRGCPLPPPGGGPMAGMFYKPSVDSPLDIAQRAFETGVATGRMDRGPGWGWGMC